MMVTECSLFPFSLRAFMAAVEALDAVFVLVRTRNSAYTSEML